MIYSNLGGMLVERAVSLAKQEELMPGYVKAWEDILKDVAMSFAVCGLMSMVIQWHRDGYPQTPRQMAQIAMHLVTHLTQSKQ